MQVRGHSDAIHTGGGAAVKGFSTRRRRVVRNVVIASNMHYGTLLSRKPGDLFESGVAVCISRLHEQHLLDFVWRVRQERHVKHRVVWATNSA